MRECPTRGKVLCRVREVFSTGFGSEASNLKLRAKVLKLEQGFGRGHASFAWAEPCQASRGAEHVGGIKVDIRTKENTAR